MCQENIKITLTKLNQSNNNFFLSNKIPALSHFNNIRHMDNSKLTGSNFTTKSLSDYFGY